MRSMRPFLTQYILFTACKALQLHTSQLSRLYPTVPHTRFSIRNPCLCLSESASPIEQKISMEILKLSTSRSRSPQIPTKFAVVGDPQKIPEKEYSIDTILKELAEIQRQGPKNYCILGTRHCTFLHQQIIELLAYALVLGGNHVFTSGAGKNRIHYVAAWPHF